MAKAKPTEETTALATRGETGLAGSVASQTFAAMEGFDADCHDGKEGITGEDLRIPFLTIAQKTSAAVDETDDAYIAGLKFGMMYNSETKDVYGAGPLSFVPLRHRKRAYLPDETGKMGEQIEWSDPRCAWPTKEQEEDRKAAGDKNYDKPEGVRVYDWIVLLLLPDGPQLAIISFKSMSFSAGQSLTTFVSMIKGPAYTGKFAIAAQLDEKPAGKFGKFVVKPAGKPTLEEAQFAQSIYASIKDRNIADEPEEPGSNDGPAVGTQASRPAASGNAPF